MVWGGAARAVCRAAASRFGGDAAAGRGTTALQHHSLMGMQLLGAGSQLRSLAAAQALASTQVHPSEASLRRRETAALPLAVASDDTK